MRQAGESGSQVKMVGMKLETELRMVSDTTSLTATARGYSKIVQLSFTVIQPLPSLQH